jgi:PilZ domain
VEKRKEERYEVTQLYRDYVTFKIREDSGRYVTAELCDFSRKGIKMKTPYRIEVDSRVECVVSAPKSLTKEISILMKVKHSMKEGTGGNYVTGAEIIGTGDDLWFDLFLRVPDFIKARIGEIF